VRRDRSLLVAWSAAMQHCPWAPARPRQGAGRRGGSPSSWPSRPGGCSWRFGAATCFVCCWSAGPSGPQRSLQQETQHPAAAGLIAENQRAAQPGMKLAQPTRPIGQPAALPAIRWRSAGTCVAGFERSGFFQRRSLTPRASIRKSASFEWLVQLAWQAVVEGWPGAEGNRVGWRLKVAGRRRFALS